MGGMMGGGSSKGAQATAAGGVSPQQAALGQYHFGQTEVKNASDYSRAGIPMSTMHTQADAGAFAQKAFELAQMSDRDAKAMADAINQQAAQQQNALGGFAEALGGAAGGGGNTGGSPV